MTPPSPESKYVKGIVTSRRELSAELWVIRLRPESKVTFNPGQYATLGLPAGENQKMIERPYSIASSPYDESSSFTWNWCRTASSRRICTRCRSGARS